MGDGTVAFAPLLAAGADPHPGSPHGVATAHFLSLRDMVQLLTRSDDAGAGEDGTVRG